MSRSVDRALSILSLFSFDKKEWGITEISNELQLSKSTVHHLVKALEARDFLRQNVNGKYRLGIKLFELGRVYSTGNELTAVSAPIVEHLVEKYKQAVHIAIYACRRAVFIVNNKGKNNADYSTFTRTGYDVPAYCTAVGKVLLAWQPPEHIGDYLEQEELVAFTPNTITNKEQLRLELEQTRRIGYAVDREETITGIACIAAPILGHSGQIIAAISVSGSADKLLQKSEFASCCEDVKKAARRISEMMGYVML